MELNSNIGITSPGDMGQAANQQPLTSGAPSAGGAPAAGAPAP